MYIYKLEIILARQKKQRKEEQTRVPRSLFDRPTAQLLKIRREHKQKSGLLKPFRPVPPPIVKPNADSSDHPEWLIHEDWALLQVIHIHLQMNIEGGYCIHAPYPSNCLKTMNVWINLLKICMYVEHNIRICRCNFHLDKARLNDIIKNFLIYFEKYLDSNVKKSFERVPIDDGI